MSPNGKVWVIGGGSSIYRGKGGPGKLTWGKIPGAAERISVGPDGNAWVVNKKGSIYQYLNNKWKRLPGKAKDIAVGADG